MSLSTSFDRGDAEARRVNKITETVIRCAIEVPVSWVQGCSNVPTRSA